MVVLVVGASGQVGWHLLQTLRGQHQTVVGTYCNHPLPGGKWLRLDIRSRAQTFDVMFLARPRVVFLPAALTNVDECENHPEQTRKVNVDGVEHVVEAARLTGSRLVYFSSDYVFDGKSGPYDEDCPPNPICEYGRQKAEAEACVLSRSVEPLVIRTTVVYGWEPQRKNFIARLVEKTTAGEQVRVPADQVGNPTYAPALAAAAVQLTRSQHSGIFNLVGAERVSRYQFALEAANVFRLDARLIVPVSTAELKQAAPRPLQAGLITRKADAILKAPLPGIRAGLTAMKGAQNER